MASNLVSIIVPVYNVEKYVERNVLSILQQTYVNFELIMINDGSTDNSLDILKKYERTDSRIKLINQMNSGVSSARNLGLKLAKGDFVVFIDGDDYIDKNHIQTLVTLITQYKAEVAVGVNHFGNFSPNRVNNSATCVISSKKAIIDIYCGKLYMAVWNKIYRKSFLEKNKIQFSDEIWYAEGMLFNIRCLSLTDKVPITFTSTYHYVNNPKSAMRNSFSLNNELCALESLRIQRKICKGMGKKVIKYNYYHQFLVLDKILNSLILKETCESKLVKDILKNIRRTWHYCVFLFIPIKQKIIWTLTCLFPKKIYSFRNKSK